MAIHAKHQPQVNSDSELKDVVFLATSTNDVWLSGVLTTGELFLWNKDQDCLKKDTRD